MKLKAIRDGEGFTVSMLGGYHSHYTNQHICCEICNKPDDILMFSLQEEDKIWTCNYCRPDPDTKRLLEVLFKR